MKVYVTPRDGLSRAMDRVAMALSHYAPGRFQFTEDKFSADLVVLHAIGYEETVRDIQMLTSSQRYAIIQYCLRSTERPRTKSWLSIWQEAIAVWSYYDLQRLAEEDHDDDFDWRSQKINFYESPLGVDATVFRPTSLNGRAFLITTSGYIAHAEGVAEVSVAAELMGGIQFHLGPEMHLGSHVKCKLGITDEELAKHYSSSQFVAGLRRGEGFELPAAEGLLCGARPIMFDAPHYRRWFDEFAEFIPETNFDEVVEYIHEIFLKGATPVTKEERELAIERFNWERIVNEFWQTV